MIYNKHIYSQSLFVYRILYAMGKSYKHELNIDPVHKTPF